MNFCFQFVSRERLSDDLPVLHTDQCCAIGETRYEHNRQVRLFRTWAAAAPFGLLQACLGLDIDAEHRVVHLSHPRLPASLEWLRIRRLRVGEARLDLLLRRHDADVAVNVLNRQGEVEVAVRL